MSSYGKFNNTQDTAGADTLSRLYFLQETGQLDASTPNAMIANIVSYGYTIANVQCTEAFVNEQTEAIGCTDISGSLVPNNKNCLDCKARAADLLAARQQLEVDAHTRNPNYTMQVLDPSIESNYKGAGNDLYASGVCQYVCEQCVLADISQNISMTISESCTSRMSSQEFRNAFVTGMSLQAETELSKHQVGLNNTGLNIQSQDDVKKLSIQIADTINQMTTVTQISSLTTDAFNIQSVIIDPGSTSVVIQQLQQSITVSMFASLVSRVFNDVNVQDSIGYGVRREKVQLDESFTDLVKSLQTTVTTMDNLLLNTVGKVMVILVVLLMIIMLIFSSFFYFKPSFLFAGIVGDSDEDEE